MPPHASFRGARVLVVGAGGLGSPVALALFDAENLATLTLIDPDRVELSNLHRQILLREEDLGREKVLSAVETLSQRRPRAALQLVPLCERLDAANAHALFASHDLVIEGSDDLSTKFLVNDCAASVGVPAIIGGVVRFSGQVLTVMPGTACYRCLFEDPPEAGTASCQAAGVLGPSCGVVGGIMAVEALRVLSGTPSYAGTLLTLDLLRWNLRRVPIGRRKDCPACQNH